MFERLDYYLITHLKSAQKLQKGRIKIVEKFDRQGTPISTMPKNIRETQFAY